MKHAKGRRKKKRFSKFLLLLVVIIFVGVYLQKNPSLYMRIYSRVEEIVSVFIKPSEYGVIKRDSNEDYDGAGQKRVWGRGYFTTFTTGGDNERTFKEYKQNGSAPWKDKPYWDGDMESSGCGITAMAIILSGYGSDVTPEDLREKYYPVISGDDIPSELSAAYGIKNSGFVYSDSQLSDEYITNRLLKGEPVLACAWNEPEKNRWTSSSHYIVLLAADNCGSVYVSNPNGGRNAQNSSGWYDIDEVVPFIAKAAFIEQ